MDSAVWISSWLSQNSQRNYPLDDDCDRKDQSGVFTIPNDFIVDMILPVDISVCPDPSLFHIMSVVLFSQGVIIVVGYNGTMMAATTSISLSSFTENSSYPLYGQGLLEDSVGRIVIGTLDTLMTCTPGAWSFDIAHTRLSPRVIIPELQGVSSVVIAQGADRSDRLQGDIILVAGSNCRLRVVNSSGTSLIYVDFVDGEGSIQPIVCDNMPQDAPCIKTINGIPPNSQGDFSFLSTSCISVTPETYGLRFQDLCSEPCCGCDELDVVNTAMETLNTQVNSLSHYINRLDGNMTQLLQAVIASKVSEIPS